MGSERILQFVTDSVVRSLEDDDNHMMTLGSALSLVALLRHTHQNRSGLRRALHTHRTRILFAFGFPLAYRLVAQQQRQPGFLTTGEPRQGEGSGRRAQGPVRVVGISCR